jgi:hypothetical protein
MAAVIVPSSLPTAMASEYVHVPVPASIPADCSRDVSAELADFLNTVGPHTIVEFAPAGCYRVERQIDVHGRVGVVLDGQGATLKRTESTPAELRYPNGNAFLELLQWTGGGVSDLRIQGINLVSDKEELGDAYGAWDQSMEFDAGINVRGGSDLVLENLFIDGTFGDGIQIQRMGGNPRNITVRDVTISHNGRQGISISSATGVLIDRANIVGSRRGGIDIEPAGTTFVAEQIEIRNSTIASWLLAFPSQGSGLANHVYIHDNLIVRTGVPFVKVFSTAGLRRTDWRVVNNTVTYGLGSPQPAMVFDNVSDVVVDGNVLRLKERRSQVAVGLKNGSTAVITNNWFLGALPDPDYVQTQPGSIWIGGNNSVVTKPPATNRWVPPSTGPDEPPARPDASTPLEDTNPPQADIVPKTLRAARATVDVREPATKGKRLRIKGRLTTSRSNAVSFLGYSGEIAIQFRARGKETFRTMAVVRSSPNGSFTLKKLKARRSGFWRVQFRGDSTFSAASSKPDFVLVVKRRQREMAAGLVVG